MFAIIKTGGKQYKVEPGTILEIEKIDGSEGDTVVFNDVLLTYKDNELKVGTPYVLDASVKGEILKQTKGEKIVIFKKKRRKGYHKKQGHRQQITVVKFTEFNF